jgi:ABC-type bacteriocin/lantibiotic exporter with double-glycine peptidase domain
MKSIGYGLLFFCCSLGAADVPYYDQKHNQNEPHRTCANTSMAMILDYWGINTSNQTQRTPDWLYQKFGVVQDEYALQAMFNQIARDAKHAIRDHFYERGTISQLRERAKKGEPTVVHGWFTESGHLVVVIGFENDHYVVHDPYGRWRGLRGQPSTASYDTTVSGRAQRYAAAQFDAVITDNGLGNDLWLHVFEPAR